MSDKPAPAACSISFVLAAKLFTERLFFLPGVARRHAENNTDLPRLAERILSGRAPSVLDLYVLRTSPSDSSLSPDRDALPRCPCPAGGENSVLYALKPVITMTIRGRMLQRLVVKWRYQPRPGTAHDGRPVATSSTR